MKKTFKYRLFTKKAQETALDGMLSSARFLYNCALEQRILCYKQWHKSINYYDQANTLKEIRSFDGCGQLVEKTLSDRVHRCSCGLVLDRDENAAINILSLGLKTLGFAPGSRLL